MDNSKAKKAVKKAKSRKSSAPADAQQVAMQLNAPGINPEVQAAAADLQPADGYVNPYRYTGAMAPTEYTAGNMLPGLQAPQMIGR